MQLLRINGKGPAHGWVARTGRRERKWKGANTDFNRDDFSRKGSQRGKLKIPRNRGTVRFPFFYAYAKALVFAYMPNSKSYVACRALTFYAVELQF